MMLNNKIKRQLIEANELLMMSEDIENMQVIVEVINPLGLGKWLIIAGEKVENGDFVLYGLYNIYCSEFGSVLLSELDYINDVLCSSLQVKYNLQSKVTIKERRKELNI